MIRASRLPMFLALSVALVVGGMIPGHHARAQERPRYGGELVFDPGQKTPEDTGEGWQIAAGHATYPQPPRASAERHAERTAILRTMRVSPSPMSQVPV